MPEYKTVIESNKFWDAPESDIFPLPVVAFVLGVGRNRMCNIPVKRSTIRGRAYYRKSDILDWALSDDGKKLLHELKGKNSSIGRAAKIKSDFYDYKLGVRGPDESKRKDLQIKRLYKELDQLDRWLERANWPETDETAQRRELAVVTFNSLAELKRRKPGQYIHRWWLICDPDERSTAHKSALRTYQSI